jgi:hypothetical protein
MAEVPEISTDMPEIAPDNAEIAPDNAEIVLDIADIEELPPKPKAKARGRPKGAANKGPSKPRAKKVQAVVEAPVAYEPSSPKRNLSIPSYDRTDELATQMLQLLASQAQGRQQKKRDLYASWMR